MEMREAERMAPEGTSEAVGIAQPEGGRRVRIPLGLRCLECGRSLFHRFSRARPCFRCEAARAQVEGDIKGGFVRRHTAKNPPLGEGVVEARKGRSEGQEPR